MDLIKPVFFGKLLGAMLKKLQCCFQNELNIEFIGKCDHPEIQTKVIMPIRIYSLNLQ